MNPESILHERGNVAVVVHKNQLSREEKDAVRYSDEIVAMGDYYALLIQEEPEDMAAFEAHHTPDPDHVCERRAQLWRGGLLVFELLDDRSE